MSRATRRLHNLLCGGLLFHQRRPKHESACIAAPGETIRFWHQSAPAAIPNAPANPAAAAAEARTRAAMAAFLRGQSSWETAGADAQRSSWVRSDPKISREGVQKPEFRFLWKVNLADKSSRANSLSSAILLNHYIGYRGFRDLAFVANEGVGIYGVDIDLGRIEWAVHDAHAQASSCPAGDAERRSPDAACFIPDCGPTLRFRPRRTRALRGR